MASLQGHMQTIAVLHCLTNYFSQFSSHIAFACLHVVWRFMWLNMFYVYNMENGCVTKFKFMPTLTPARLSNHTMWARFFFSQISYMYTKSRKNQIQELFNLVKSVFLTNILPDTWLTEFYKAFCTWNSRLGKKIAVISENTFTNWVIFFTYIWQG